MAAFFAMFFSLATALFFLAFYILAIAFMFWMAVDAAKHDRFWWIVIIIALPLVGAVAYYAVERKHLYIRKWRRVQVHSQNIIMMA